MPIINSDMIEELAFLINHFLCLTCLGEGIRVFYRIVGMVFPDEQTQVNHINL